MAQTTFTRRRTYTGAALAVLVFAGTFAYLVGGITVSRDGDWPAFHIDEAHKLTETYYYHIAFERRSLNHPAWHQDFYARTNPPVAKYIFGAVLAACGHHITDQSLQDDFERLWQTPDKLRERVPNDMLQTTRRTSALFAALTCMLLFVVAYRISGVAVGLIAPVLLLANPDARLYAQRGLTDTVLWFHLTLIMPATFWATRRLACHWRDQTGTTPGRWVWLLVRTAFVPGLVVALAAGSKLNGALAGIAYTAALVLTAAIHTTPPAPWRRLALAIVLAAITAAAAILVFAAIDPYFHHDPVSRAIDTLHVYRDWMIKQQLEPGGGLFSLRQKVTATAYFSLNSMVLPQYIYLGRLGTWITMLGLAVGLVCIIGRLLLHQSPDADPPSATTATPDQARLDAGTVLCWFIICAAGVTLWLPVAWHRYLIVPCLAIAFVTATGLANLPRGFLALVDACLGVSQGPNRARLVLGFVGTVMIWAPLSFTSWVVEPALLDPTVFPEMAGTTGYRLYVDGVKARPNSPAIRRHLGVVLLKLGRYAEARAQFETALEQLGDDTGGNRAMTVQRCCLLYDLARSRAALGQRFEAIEALNRHVALVERLRDGMASTDPKVRAGYNQVIAHHRQVVARMLQTRSGASRPSSRAQGEP